jgi:hypothetical protein
VRSVVRGVSIAGELRQKYNSHPLRHLEVFREAQLHEARLYAYSTLCKTQPRRER